MYQLSLNCSAEEERKQGVMKRIVARILHQALSTCLLAWAEHVQEELAKRVKLRRIVLRMTGNVLGR